MPLVSKTFSQIITFTRASSATYFDATGTLQTATTDAPRFDYNPSTLAAQGLLIEEARTNLLTYSEQFDNAVWTKEASVSVSANTTSAPNGTTTADTVTADVDKAIYQSVTATIGTTYCQSVFIKAGTATSILFRDDTGAGRSITINPSTGAITATGGTLVTSGSQAIGNGWWRYWLAYVADATTVRGLLRPSTGGAAQTFIVWGTQTEVGAFPTSYIPTTTTAVTRAADVASVNTLSPWYNATAGTIYAEAQVAAGIGSAPAVMAGLDDTTINNRMQLRRQTPGTTGDFRFVSSGGNFTGSAAVGTLAGVNKQAGAYAASDQAGAVNGTLMTSIVSVATLPTITRLALGDGQGSTPLNGWLRRVSYYPRRLSNAELQSITT